MDADTAPPVLFLHGLLGNKRNFATIARSLSGQLQKQRRIVGLDLRNHGDNHHDWRTDMSYQSMAADVLDFMDRHDLDAVELVGHSVGGKVAQAVALLEPDRIDGLCVLDIAPVAYSADEPHWKAVLDIINVLTNVELFPGIAKRDVDRQLQPHIPDPALRAFCLTNLDDKAGRWGIALDSIAEQLHELADFDVTGVYDGDAFFIHGGQSRFVRHSHLTAIKERFPNHLLTTVRGAGHWVHAEAPEDTTALLKRFLDREARPVQLPL
jgi:pimeloyl-ACP methyl ester carboxylesterase